MAMEPDPGRWLDTDSNGFHNPLTPDTWPDGSSEYTQPEALLANGADGGGGRGGGSPSGGISPGWSDMYPDLHNGSFPRQPGSNLVTPVSSDGSYSQTGEPSLPAQQWSWRRHHLALSNQESSPVSSSDGAPMNTPPEIDMAAAMGMSSSTPPWLYPVSARPVQDAGQGWGIVPSQAGTSSPADDTAPFRSLPSDRAGDLMSLMLPHPAVPTSLPNQNQNQAQPPIQGWIQPPPQLPQRPYQQLGHPPFGPPRQQAPSSGEYTIVVRGNHGGGGDPDPRPGYRHDRHHHEHNTSALNRPHSASQLVDWTVAQNWTPAVAMAEPANLSRGQGLAAAQHGQGHPNSCQTPTPASTASQPWEFPYLLDPFLASREIAPQQSLVIDISTIPEMPDPDPAIRPNLPQDSESDTKVVLGFSAPDSAGVNPAGHEFQIGPAAVRPVPRLSPASSSLSADIPLEMVTLGGFIGPSTGPLRTRGGRQLGSHLNPDSRRDAHAMREVGACWACALQKHKCGPGDPCPRCVRRISKTLGPHAQLECDRTPLWELVEFFIPARSTLSNRVEYLQEIVQAHAVRWTAVSMKILLRVGKCCPLLVCHVQEFVPNPENPPVETKYFKLKASETLTRFECISPPIAMLQIEDEDLTTYSKYIDDTIRLHFTDFACDFTSNNGGLYFLRTLLLTTRTLDPKGKDERDLIHEAHRLLVSSFILGHAIGIVDSMRDEVLARLRHDPRPTIDYGDHFITPIILNRQLKYLFYNIYKTSMRDVYKRLQQMLKNSAPWSPTRWVSLLCAMMILAMAHEDSMIRIQWAMDNLSRSGALAAKAAIREADILCEGVQAKFEFITGLFLHRTIKMENPLVHHDDAYWVRHLDPNYVVFCQEVKTVVNDNYILLRRQANNPGGVGWTDSYVGLLAGKLFIALLDPAEI